MSTRTETLQFRRQQDERTARAARQRARLEVRHPATIARRLALAHRIAEEVESGKYSDYADVARQHGLTRARVTQLMNLLLLAPDIQEEVLALEFPVGREAVTERHLRRVLGSLCWEHQRKTWWQVFGAPA
jgi:hypothetical protein